MGKIFRAIFFVAFMFAGMNARVQAEGSWVDCNRTNGVYQYFASTVIQVGKDAKVGDLLGGWMTSSNPTAWTCAQRNTAQTISPQMAVLGYPPYPIWNAISTEGQTYSVYNTTVKSGLGYVSRWRYTVKGQTSVWYPLTVAPGIFQIPAELFPVTYDSGKSFNVGVDVQIRFVKTATSLSAGPTPLFDPMYMRHYQTYGGASEQGSGTYMIAQFANGAAIIATGGTCTTPNVDVTLPPQPGQNSAARVTQPPARILNSISPSARPGWPVSAIRLRQRQRLKTVRRVCLHWTARQRLPESDYKC
ncbi:hypothetical protein EDF78_101246 [Rahnella sp. BIGb0236]|nr:hypothetical protein [Rahnella sp. BIGb0236]TDS97871.1 hypothetical protein EDF78_101246 [Rahnella sp. BIGb0236]VTQ52549.1 Uncharacterised protein [Campylobacter jejuni]